LLVRIHGSISFKIANPVKAITNIGESTSSEKRFEGDEEKKKREARYAQTVFKTKGPKSAETQQTKHPDLKTIIFETILTRANNNLAALLTGSDLLTSGGAKEKAVCVCVLCCVVLCCVVLCVFVLLCVSRIKPQGLGFASAAAAMQTSKHNELSEAKGKAEESFYGEKERHKVGEEKNLFSSWCDGL